MSFKNLAAEFHSELGSTQDRARESLATLNESDIFWVVAESQNKGRGRLGRQWTSPMKGDALLLSAAFKLPIQIKHLSFLTLLAGVSAFRALMHYKLKPERQVFLKWPNDLYVCAQGDYFKIGGILCEQPRKLNFTVGWGINLHSHPPGEKSAGNLQEHLEIVREDCRPKNLLEKIQKHFKLELESWLNDPESSVKRTIEELNKSLMAPLWGSRLLRNKNYIPRRLNPDGSLVVFCENERKEKSLYSTDET